MKLVPGSKPVTESETRRPGPSPRARADARRHALERAHRRPSRPRQVTPPGHRRTPAGSTSSTSGRPRLRWLRAVTKLVFRLSVGVVILIVFVIGVFPTSRYIDQRDELDRATTELRELERENAELRRQVGLLESDEEMERVAREEYDMVFPEEEVYAVLPPAGG